MPHQARALLCTCSKNICHKNSSHLLFFFSGTGCKKNWAKPLRHRHDFEAFGTKSWLLDAICMLFYGQQQFFLIWICDRVGRMDHEYLVCSLKIDLNAIFCKLYDTRVTEIKLDRPQMALQSY